MRKELSAGLLLVVVALAPPALAQQAVQTYPAPVSTAGGNQSGTITSSNVFQKVFGAASGGTSGGGPTAPRKGCLIQNNGTHTMWVSEGATAATATEASSWQVSGGGTFSCESSGVVWTGEIDITGTAGDAFSAAQY